MTVTPIRPTTPPPQQPPSDVRLLRQLAGRYDGPAELADQMALASALAGAREGLPPMYRDSPGDVLVAIYQARALDIPVMVALNQLFYDNGRTGMSGALMLALIIRAGHRVKVIGRPNAQLVEMELERCDDQPGGRVSWTINEAVVAQLTIRRSWQEYPADMLYWRCLARLGRQYASDVLQGFGYLPEELLNGGAADDTPQREVTVDGEVQEFLRDLDLLDLPATRALLVKAHKLGLADRVADSIDGTPITVAQVIASVVERRAAAAAVDAAPPAEAAVAAAHDDLLDCGCLIAEVVMTGTHRDACAAAANPLLPTDPAGGELVDDEPAAPVVALPRRCCPGGINDPHQGDCVMAEFEKAWGPTWPPQDDES